MADFEFKVSGLKETQAALYSYSQQLGDKVVVSALTLGARVFARQAKANAPVRSGRLRRAIFVKRSKIFVGKFDTGQIGVYVSVRRGKTRDDPKGAWYGHIVEKGFNTKGEANVRRSIIVAAFTKRTRRKTARGKTDVAGKFFMRDAFISQRNAAVNLAIAATKRGAESVKRKLGLR